MMFTNNDILTIICWADLTYIFINFNYPCLPLFTNNSPMYIRHSHHPMNPWTHDAQWHPNRGQRRWPHEFCEWWVSAPPPNHQKKKRGLKFTRSHIAKCQVTYYLYILIWNLTWSSKCVPNSILYIIYLLCKKIRKPQTPKPSKKKQNFEKPQSEHIPSVSPQFYPFLGLRWSSPQGPATFAMATTKSP